MNLAEKQIIKILREEYNKRISHFLEEKITIKDKRGMNLVQDAIGLKVRDKAGFEYTIGGIVKKGSEEFMKLYLPEFGRESVDTPATSGLNEFDFNNEEDDFGADDDFGGFISRSSRMKGRKGLDVSKGFAGEDYLDHSVEDTRKKEEKKYILVPMGEFEAKFEI